MNVGDRITVEYDSPPPERQDLYEPGAYPATVAAKRKVRRHDGVEVMQIKVIFDWVGVDNFAWLEKHGQTWIDKSWNCVARVKS